MLFFHFNFTKPNSHMSLISQSRYSAIFKSISIETGSSRLILSLCLAQYLHSYASQLCLVFYLLTTSIIYCMIWSCLSPQLFYYSILYHNFHNSSINFLRNIRKFNKNVRVYKNIISCF